MKKASLKKKEINKQNKKVYLHYGIIDGKENVKSHMLLFD